MADSHEADKLFMESLLHIGRNMTKPITARPYQDNCILQMLASLGIGSGWINLYQPGSHSFYSIGKEFLIESSETKPASRKLQAKHFSSEVERDASSSHGVAIELYLLHTAIGLIKKRHCWLEEVCNAAPRLPSAATMATMLKEELRERGEEILAEEIDKHTTKRLLGHLDTAANGKELNDTRARREFLADLLDREVWDWIPFRIVWAEERLATIICYQCLEELRSAKSSEGMSENATGASRGYLWDKIRKKYHFVKRIKKENWDLDLMVVKSAIKDLTRSIIDDRNARLQFSKCVTDDTESFEELTDAVFSTFYQIFVEGRLDLGQVVQQLHKQSACRAKSIEGTGWKHLLIFPVVVGARFQGCFLGEFLMERDQLPKFRLGRERLRLVLQLLALAMLIQPKTDQEVGPYKRAVEAMSETLERYEPNQIVGKSTKIREVCQKVAQIASSDISVLITGETGTGKNLVARAVHYGSKRRSGPLVEVDCSTLPQDLLESELFGHVKGAFTGADKDKKGRFEIANGGTIFLDEIGNMNLEVQTKLLRVLDSGQFESVGSNVTKKTNARIIAATNCPIKEKINEGTFREDLFYRLKGIMIEVPPLRERREDIPELVAYMSRQFIREGLVDAIEISEEAMVALKTYDWPGNVRELENVIKCASIIAKGSSIGLGGLDLPTVDRQPVNMKSSEHLRYQETLAKHDILRKVIAKAKGNKTKAAKILGISRRTLYNRLEKANMVRGVKKDHFTTD